MAQVSLVNGAETLVFSPESVQSGHILFQNAAQPVLAKRELLHFDRPKDEKKEIRRSIRTNFPLVRTVGDAEVMKMETGKTEFIFPSDSTAAERERLVLLHIEGLKSTFAMGVIVDVEWAW